MKQLSFFATEEVEQETCSHPPTRLFAWYANDGTLCVCCCECGAVLKGGAQLENETEEVEDVK